MRRLRLLPAIWLFALLALPTTLWLLGVRQPNLQNTPKAALPAINRGSLMHGQTFTQLDGALLDRLPLRGQALSLHGDIAIDLFHDSPNPQVAIGHHGWLYYVPETATCQPNGTPLVDPATAADSADVLARTLVASGRNTTVVFAGSKLFTHPSDAPSIAPTAARCASELNSVVQERLRNTPGGLDLAPELGRLEQEGKPVFLRNDSHWNWRGRQVFSRRVLDRIRPQMAEESGLGPGAEVNRDGDLAMLMGVARRERDPALVAKRTPAAPPRAGSVLLIGDSQLERSLLDPTGVPGVLPIRDVVLPGQPSCNWTQVVAGACDDAIRQAHTIVVESVAREIIGFSESRCWRPISLAAEPLRGTPGRWERVDGGPQPGRAALTIPASGAVTVRVRPANGDGSSVPRLLRLPIATLPPAPAGAPPSAVVMTQAPQDGPAAPCATPAQGAVHGALFLPVPAERRASDLVVTLQGPPGTRLSPPQTIALDGRPAPRVGGS
ncbi:MAG: hypothetical protein JWQ48_2828 [Conexibacter sp.]|nr:hypothetical protein [Conexibacter sp.]